MNNTRLKTVDDIPRESNESLSMLQLEILTKLKLSPGSTVTQVAGGIKSHRPAVSRAMQTLRTKGLAEQRHRAWFATEQGLIQAEQRQEAFRQNTQALQETAHKAFEGLSRWQTKQSFLVEAATQLGQRPLYIGEAWQTVTEDLTKALRGSLQTGIAGALTHQMGVSAESQLGILGGLAREMGRSFAPVLAQIAESQNSALNAMSSLAQAQSACATMLPNVSEVWASPGFQDMLTHNTQTIALAMSEITSFSRLATTLPIADLPKIELWRGLAGHIDGIAGASRGLVQDAVANLSQPLFRPAGDEFDSLSFRMAPLVMNDFAVGARAFIEAELEPHSHDLVLTHRESWDDVGKLDAQLYRLNPELVGIRRGAWHALRSRNPDKVRHASTSMRELVWQTLRLLVPGIQVPDGAQPGTKVKTQVKHLLGGSDSNAEFVDRVADAVSSTLDQLSKRTHTNGRHIESTEALLGVADSLLYFVLVNTQQHGSIYQTQGSFDEVDR